MILAILPEILILALGFIVLLLDVFLPDEKRRNLGWVTAGGLALILVISIMIARPGVDDGPVWGGMLRYDWMGFLFKMLFLFGAAITALFASNVDELGKRGEYYLLMLASTIGMCLMASSGDLIMLFLAIETTSIPLYIQAGFLTGDDKSTESGVKYLLFGAMTSAILLYGFSLLFGFGGTTDLYVLAGSLGDLMAEYPLPVIGGLLLALVGFAFKTSLVPFHFWAPDVYEGAPTPVAGFLSTASKAAGFAALARFLLVVFPFAAMEWGALLAIISAATMTLGNLIALAQTNIKRLLAYSSVAHAGYILMGLAAVAAGSEDSVLGLPSVVFYLIAYMVTNLAAFGGVVIFWRVTGSDEIKDYAGLSRRSPTLALAFMVALLSLAGIPPMGGFIAKVLVFAAAIETKSLIWLAVLGVINAIVGIYYYLMILKVIYLDRGENEEEPLPVPRPYAVALAVCIIGILLLGTLFAPWFDWASAVSGLF